MSYTVERSGDEVIVTSELMFDVSSDYRHLVLSLKQARRIAEALLEQTVTINWSAEEEDG